MTFSVFRQTKGQSLVELLMTIGLAAILMPAFLVGFSATRQGRAQQDQRLQAIAYVREAAEAVRIVRDNGWTSIPANGTYCPQPSGTTWTLKSYPQNSLCDTPAAGFTRTIVIGDTYRVSATNAIDPTGTSSTATDYLDSSTKTVTVSVTWSTPISSSVRETMYLTRHDSLSSMDTTYANFSAGDTNGGTTVTKIYDGEVQIGGGGSSDWCAPGTPITYATSSNHNEYSISAFSSTGTGVSDYAYTTFGDSANQPALSKWIVPDTPSPTPSSGGTYTPNGEKTYGMYATSNAVFITSNKSNLTVDIVNPSTLTQAGYFQDSGGETGRSVYLGNTNTGNEGFVTACTYTAGSGCTGSYKLYAFDYHTTPLTGSRTQDGVVSLTGSGRRVVVVNKYAFVAENSTTAPLEIYYVADPTKITKVYSGNPFSTYQSTPQGATDLYIDPSGTFGYLVTAYDSSADIFYMQFSNFTSTSVSVSVPYHQTTSVSGGGTMSPNGVIAVSQNHIVVVGSGGYQYQVFYSPTLNRCQSSSNGMLNIGYNVKSVAAVSEADGDNFAYILTDNPNGELQIIPGGQGSGGGGGGGGNGSGTFISQAIPVPTLAAAATFNNFFPVADTPPPTSIQYQVAVSSDCSTYTFVGPDGTSNTKFATSSAIPLTGTSSYANPGKCFKYKAFLSSGGSTTASPILYQVNVSYSP